MSAERSLDDELTSAVIPDAPTEEVRTGPLKRDLVAGLEKGLAVIEAFDQERPRLTISEVAGRTGLTRAAARRYLLTLTHLGFVSQDRKMFALTPKVLRLGQSYMHSARLPRIIEPELHKLAYAMKEASSAGVLDGNDVICISATSAGRVVSPTLQPGTRVPAYCTANGRVLLAAQSQADRPPGTDRADPAHHHAGGTPAHRNRPRPRPGVRADRPGTGTGPAFGERAAEELQG